MAKSRSNTTNSDTQPHTRPALTPEAREQQMIALAVDCAEKQMRDGTASSQIITHYLKLATENARLQNKLLDAQAAVAMAKKEQIQSQKRSEELFVAAMKAMSSYRGLEESDESYESYESDAEDSDVF